MKQSISSPRSKALVILNVLLALFLSGCEQGSAPLASGEEPPAKGLVTEVVALDDATPTVEMTKYSLVSDGSEGAQNDASEIMSVKRRWPLAMQSKNVEEFESILGKDFVFVGAGNLISRGDYIKDRTAPNDWQITHVVYSNMTLQLFGNRAVLSYRNRVTNDNRTSGEKEIEIIHWVDVFEKEGNEWKIAAAHVIDFRIE